MKRTQPSKYEGLECIAGIWLEIPMGIEKDALLEILKGKKVTKRDVLNAIKKIKNAQARKHKPRHRISKETRKAVLERDGHICARCKSEQGLHVHHIERRADGGTDDMTNLITLCKRCHTIEHDGEPVYNLMIKAFAT